uniref:OSJNBb0088C09.18 protein n=3 Tax=Oryza sativa TaxID=4530 RepID=A0A5S6RCJ4_ORYSJ|nr:OSJNBa0035I04.8 [Oryza sativa Japonica Group]CAE05959.1 OSJNBb0088C09.18 [Oryza sativa Japonica Group]CAH66490.1 OSIGBa0076I14.11 [Oryza sativa]
MPGIRNDSHNLATESFGLQQSDSNDTIIFMEHDLEEAKNLKLVLSTFERLAGLNINFHKSELFCFGRAKEVEREYVTLFGCGSGILEKLDYYRSRFFWQCEEHKKKYRLAKWSILCKPKECGGLGIQNLELQNKYMLSKWLYKLWNEEGVWQNLLRRKYLSKKTLTHVDKKSGDSHFWSGLMMVKNIFLSCGSLKVHNGTQVRFWEDKWNGNTPFAARYPALYNLVINKNESVAVVMSKRPLKVSFRRAMVGHNLKAWLEVVSKVISIKLTEQNGTFLWEIQKNGCFSVNSMYKAIMYREVVPKKDMIWKLRIPLKIKIFLWYLKNGVILTKDNLAKSKWKGDFQGDFLGKTMVFAT